MDVELYTMISTGVAFLSPYLKKASEKAAETIGQKFAEKSIEKSFWNTVKGVFTRQGKQEVIEKIEGKSVANTTEIALIEHTLKEEARQNPEFIQEIKEALNINSMNEFLVTEKFASIQRLQIEIKKLEEQMERAGIASAGDYQNRIELQRKKMEYQVSEVLKILNA